MTRLNPTCFTTKEELLELMVAKQFGKLHIPTRGEVRKFTAIALTDSVPMSDLAFDNFIGAALKDPPSPGVQSRYIVKAMIVGDETGDRLRAKNNPHRKIPNPCSYTESEDSAKAISIIMLYTTFMSAKDFSIADNTPVRRNDKILVSLTVGSDGRLNMERGEMISLIARSEDEFPGLPQCAHLSQLFDRSAFGAPASPLGPTILPGGFSGPAIPGGIKCISPDQDPVATGIDKFCDQKTLPHGDSPQGATSIQYPISKVGPIYEYDNPPLIFVYPGVGKAGYGERDWVAEHILNADYVGYQANRIIVIAKQKDTNWANLKTGGLQLYKSYTGLEKPGTIRLVGWSGGAAGLKEATNDPDIEKIWYADPYPPSLFGAPHGASVKMYYNPKNWGISGATEADFTKLAAEVKNSALVDATHDEIFFRSMKEALVE